MPDRPSESSLSRRTFIAASAVAGAGLAWGPGALTPAAAAGAGWRGVEQTFADPASRYGARFRWWWPHGLVDPGQVQREVREIARAGFGGMEIADVHHSIRDGGALDPEGHGWGTPAWTTAVKAAFRQADRDGVTLDLTAGPSWPAAVPGVTPDDDAAIKELAHGLATVEAGQTYDGEVPAPVVAAEEHVQKTTLLAVQAVRLVTPSTRESTLDASSLVDLTAEVRDGRIRWTAPAEGTWLLFSYWERGSGQLPEAGPHTSPEAFVVDHFSAKGTKAVTDFWEENILDRELRRLIKRAGATFFEDSLEIETGATIWTPGMLEAFRARNGYDLAPFLPVIVEVKEKYLYTYDPDLTTRVRDDLAMTFSDLYRDHHLIPLRDWAHDLGLELRIQAYGLETDTLAHSGLLDQPETESLGFKNLDDYRVMAGGRDLAGRTILSCEAAAYNGAAYNVTWDRVLTTLNSIYAAGVNQAVLHGYPYAEAPGAAWPGFAAFSPYGGAPGYSEAWGPRQPSWKHVPAIADYLRRTQWVLQQGRNRTDLVYFRQKGWAATGIGAQWATNDGIPLGWSHTFISSAVLADDSVTLRDGRLAPDGPAYKAMVVEGDAFRGRRTTLTVEAAKKIADLAKRGFPIVFLGDWSTPTADGRGTAADDAVVAEAVRTAFAQPNVRNAAVAADIPTALADLGVERQVSHERSTVVHQHRRTGDADLFLLANARHAENRPLSLVEQEVSLTATRGGDLVPYVLDAWTGEVRRVAVYRQEGRTFTVRVRLTPGSTTVVALASRGWADKRSAKTAHVVSTDAADARLEARSLVVRASAAGAYSVALSNGRTRTARVAAVPDPVELTSWTLVVEDWRPGRTPTTTDTVRSVHRLETLVPWTEVPGLEDASGIGRYTTTVTLPRTWDRTVGAYLDLGAVLGTYAVKVNGRAVVASPTDTRVDVGHLLRAGVNHVEVEVATTLFNRMRTAQPEVFGGAARVRTGLVGPVRVLPYGEATVDA
ncbi:glycosyl hydrolase [Mumia quercus]|uniref:glycosyl hydrolase n=1 Tax=Mumia quercus TaxID=2976125 RepID=UPI0021D1C3FC|nr:glycosyl hydrolase [Mumia quercus]